jgi:hypothetical protein
MAVRQLNGNKPGVILQSTRIAKNGDPDTDVYQTVNSLHRRLAHIRCIAVLLFSLPFTAGRAEYTCMVKIFYP